MNGNDEHNKVEQQVLDENSALTESSTPDAHISEDTEIKSDSEINNNTDLKSVASEGDLRPKKKHTLVVLLVILGLVLVGGASAYFYFNQEKPQSASAPGSVDNQALKLDSQAPDQDVLARFIKPTTGEKWLSQVKPLGDLKLFKSDKYNIDEMYKPKYSEVGSRNDNQIIAGEHIVGIVTKIDLFEKSPDGKYSLILNPDANMITENDENTIINIKNSLTDLVAIDEITHYDSLTPPDKLKLDDGVTVVLVKWSNFAGGSSGVNLDDKDISKSLVKEYGTSKLYRVDKKYVDTGLSAINYAIKPPVGFVYTLEYKPINMELSSYTWNNGVNVEKPAKEDFFHSSKMSPIIRGCGSSANAYSIVNNISQSELEEIGKTDTGEAVYGFKDSNNSILNKAYDEYASPRKQDPKNYPDVPDKNTFIRNHAVVLYKNSVNEWMIYTRDQYQPFAGGCAKPVVYLYPTKDTKVNVRVGANVSISEPQYDASRGWTVLAHPNGTLDLNGKQYDSLFWEGQGHGSYPGIASGTVVKRSDAAATMQRQLFEQGLNKKETADFMKYWQSKIPNKPYVRLTWFNTSQMESLAPLYISPKPQTLIRIFLDMGGYDAKISISSQTLTKVPRIGYTAVEWGGLAGGILK